MDVQNILSAKLLNNDYDNMSIFNSCTEPWKKETEAQAGEAVSQDCLVSDERGWGLKLDGASKPALLRPIPYADPQSSTCQDALHFICDISTVTFKERDSSCLEKQEA